MRAGMIALLLAVAGCRSKPTTCEELVSDAGSSASRLPTSFSRTVETLRWQSCADGKTYELSCRYGSLRTTCECRVNGELRIEAKLDGRIPEGRGAATDFANATCEWSLQRIGSSR